MKLKLLIPILFVCIVQTSCFNRSTMIDTHEVVVAKYNDIPLYLKELEKNIPKGISEVDSSLCAQRYIHGWLLNRAIELEAVNNLSNLDEVNKQVDDYRRDLLRYYYLKEIAVQAADKWNVKDAEVFDYYVKHDSDFIAPKDYVKYIYVKTDYANPDLSDLRREVKDGDIDKLEAYIGKVPIEKQIVDNQWVELKSLEALYPIVQDFKTKAQKDLYEEHRTAGTIVLFKVLDFCASGTKSPVELVSGEIKNILKNKKKKDFIDNFENGIYQKDLSNGNIFLKK